MAFVQPLDLQTIFVNYLAGSIPIFMFLAFIAIAGLSAMFRMPNLIFLTMMGLFAVFMADFYPDAYFITILIVGTVVFYGISSAIKR